ncbi:MAG: radical SAM protein [Gammaproteobacteria bacterium]|nr:MAG: radical SAM protein [Gammaproteobacteria bacterium]
MKCALIHPAWSPEEIFPSKTVASQINYWQPLGTLYVGASLLKAGHEVNFFNGAFMSHEELLCRVKEFKPDFAGLYSTTFGWPKAMRTADAIKKLDKAIFTCVGGPYPIAMQEQCLNNESASIDAVVTGEAELTMVELLARLQHSKDLDGVLGVVFRQGTSIIKNPPRPLTEDLDALPFPARELLGDMKQYIPPPATYKRKPVTILITSRGCDRRCIFCFQIDKHRKSGKRGIRFRSVENVMQEIGLCLKQGYREIKFIDDTFAANYDRAMRICQAIKARRLNFTWFASACINQVDKPLLQAMKDAGCWSILFGADSGVQKTLNALRKATTLEQIRRDVRAAKEVGLKVSTPFIFGAPGETFADGLKTIEFAIELDADLANFHALTPFPGTYLHDNLDKFGSVSGDLSDRNYQSAAFVPYTMSRDEILTLRQLAFRRFYSRPAFLLRRLLAIRTLNDCQVAGRGLQSLFWLWAGKNLFHKRKPGVVTPVKLSAPKR